MSQNRIFPFAQKYAARFVFLSVLALGVGVLAGEGKSALVHRVTFTVAPSQMGAPGPPAFGLPGTGVEAEYAGPFLPPPSGPDSNDDDVYLMDEIAFMPFFNIKLIDDGYPTIPIYGTGVMGPPPGFPPPPQATIPTDLANMNALAMEPTLDLPDFFGNPEFQWDLVRMLFLEGSLVLQFSVDNAAMGLPLTAVEWEALAMEAPGDVFEAVFPPGGTNVLLADEDSLGLLAIPEALNDDVDGMIVQDILLDPMAPLFHIDTDGDGAADTPWFFFSVDSGSIPLGSPPFFASDILTPGTGIVAPPTPAPEPLYGIHHTSLGLTPDDDLDALFVDITGDAVLFSLAAGSPSLNTVFNPIIGAPGANPGDIIFVDTTPALPWVVLMASEIGIRGDLVPGGGPDDDELNALWVTDHSLYDQFAPLAVTADPSGSAKCIGDSATFTVSATGTPPIHYQWFKGGVAIPGAVSSSLTINPVGVGDAGAYHCDIINQFEGPYSSQPATLTVMTPVNITTHPFNYTYCPGDSVTFSVTATGTPAPTYQWRHNGGDIPGAINSTFQIPSIIPADAGTYDCLVTNPCGTVPSQAGALIVDGPLDATVDPHWVVAQGIAFVVWDAILDCAIPTIEIQWENLDSGFQYTLNQDPITINPKPSSTTHYQVTVTDEITREVVQRPATLLVAVHTDYFDYFPDNCNSLLDLYLLAEEWLDLRPLNDDPNGDGIIDIRDYLYINLDDPAGCP